MSDGLRDAFIENDVIGNYNLGATSLVSKRSTRRKKRHKKANRKMPNSRRRKGKYKSYVRVRKRKSHKSKKGRKYPHWLKKYWFKKKR